MKRNKFAASTLSILALLIFHPFNYCCQIASLYPNDSLIQNDPNVIFTEMFEQGSIGSLISGGPYTTTSNTLNLAFDPSVPPGSLGTQSCKFTTFQTPAQSQAMELTKKFTTGISDSVFVRYYIKYNNAHTFHHSGIWIGGTNPAYSCWPCNYPGRVGVPPGGDSAFALGSEVNNALLLPQTNAKFGLYNYWTKMHSNNSGQFYGNEFVSPNANSTISMTQWNCIEVMLKLNNPVSDSTGEAKLWINGQLVGHYGKGFPNGTWNQTAFNEGSGSPFSGFQWRSNAALMFNYIWIKNYATNNASYTSANDVWYDHIVVAKKYIGPIFNPLKVESLKDDNDELDVYPNPTEETLNFSRAINSFVIYDMLGQKVTEQKNLTKSISVRELNDGVYFIHSDGFTAKFLVKH